MDFKSQVVAQMQVRSISIGGVIRMIVEYTSNNSGGSWWLTDEDWKNLEKAGWTVDWAKTSKHKSKYLDKGGERWLGALATSAKKEFLSVDCAIAEWEHITGQSAGDEGCECCGQPHSFDTEYLSTSY